MIKANYSANVNMQNEGKAKQQIIEELLEARRRIAELAVPLILKARQAEEQPLPLYYPSRASEVRCEMSDLGKILIADDEETFLRSTADLLRREGYECDCVPDGITASGLLRSKSYDLLIADIKMPGNPQLELIKDLHSIIRGMPVILVTGYPSLKSAIQSIQLPVAAYLVKPFDFGELLVRVQSSIEKFRVYRTICSLRQNLQEWSKELTDIEEVLIGMAEDTSPSVIDAFFELTFQNIVGALSDMKHLAEASFLHNFEGAPLEPCHLFNCPRLNTLRDALVETIGVLEKTKNAFKSRDLGELRQRLEGMSVLR